jgi:hypothetical protein
MSKGKAQQYLKHQKQCVAVMMLVLNNNYTCWKSKQVCCDTEVVCCRRECKMLKSSKRVIIWEKIWAQTAFCRPNLGNFNAIVKKILEFVLEKHKNGLHCIRETKWIKVLEVATSLKILQQDFKASNAWTMRYMCPQGLAVNKELHYWNSFPKTTLIN